MNLLVVEIQKYLDKFQNQSLLDGDSVRDALLDLMLLAQDHATPIYCEASV